MGRVQSISGGQLSLAQMFSSTPVTCTLLPTVKSLKECLRSSRGKLVAIPVQFLKHGSHFLLGGITLQRCLSEAQHYGWDIHKLFPPYSYNAP